MIAAGGGGEGGLRSIVLHTIYYYNVYIQYNIPLVHYYYIAQVGKWMMSTAFSILFNSMTSVVEYQFWVNKIKINFAYR